MEPVNTLRPGDRLGDFEIVRQLGRGGMGVVYLARDERLGRGVALKVIAPHLAHDREFQRRFEAEARSAAAIEHPNAVPIYSAGSIGGSLFIAMRYVAGTDLREALARSGPLPATAAATVVAEVGAALDAAHAAGFVHRDVKPANVLLTGEPGKGTAFLTDFGLTRGLGSDQTQLTGTGQWIGTLDYVAPEQMAAGRVDARTDIYSLGCVLYEMVAGSVPFTGDEMQKLWRKANEEPPALPQGPRSSALDSVLARALARDPARRFRSAGDLGRAALTAAGAGGEAPTERSIATGVAAAGMLEGEPRPAPPPPARGERPTARMEVRGPRRRGTSAGALAIVVLSLAVAGGLVAGALLLANERNGGSSTVVRRSQAAVSPTPAPAVEDEGTVERERLEEELEQERQRKVALEARQSAAAVPDSTTFDGALFSVSVPAGWAQEEDEESASDGSYIANAWVSPDGAEKLKIDASPGVSASAAESAVQIAASLRDAGAPVYSVRHAVLRGGFVGSELTFRSDSEPPLRVDFFFDVGADGYAVLGCAYDLETARGLVADAARSLELR